MSVVCTGVGSAAPSSVEAATRETFSDEMLIRRIADGDQLAMRTLFCRHRVALYRWLLRLVRDEALAEDLLSDVFLDVWRKAASSVAWARARISKDGIRRWKSFPMAALTCRRTAWTW